MKKRTFAMILVLCIIFSVLPLPGSAATNPFTDVKKSDYYYDAVIWAVENGITAGTSANKFSPNATCSRGQIVTFLWRSAGQPEPTTKVNPFSDVKSSDYFYKAVLWAVENGITSGTGNGKFSPNMACSRGQVATFLWRAEGEPDASGTNPFSDVKSSEYYYKAVLWAVENGITSGTGNGKFSPNMACSRGQIVTFLYRADDVKDEPVNPEPTEPEPTEPEPTEPEPTEPEPTEPDPNEIVNSGVCGDDVSWTLTAGGTLTISGSGPMWEYENTSDRPFPQKEVKRIVIQSGITRISRNAFFSLSHVEEVSIPNTVTSIGWQAFAWCKNLKSVTIPNSVTTLDGYAFNGCSGLTSVRIPASVTEIKQGVFANATSLTAILVDAANTKYYSENGVLFSYDNWLMQYPAGLKGDYSVPSGTTWLYHYSFNGCESITSVTLPASIAGLGSGAFKDCVGLTEIFFTGDAPTFQDEEDNAAGSFRGVTATAYYPKNNGTWTRDVRQNYGGDITWVSYKPEIPDEGPKELQRSEIEVYLIIPSLNDFNAYVQLEIHNYSDKPMTIPTYIGVGDKAVHQESQTVLNPGYYAKIYFFRATLKEDRYEDKYYDMYLDKNSTGYMVITWNGDQYYCEYGVDGIFEFYRGNVNGPATDPVGPDAVNPRKDDNQSVLTSCYTQAPN